MGDNPNHRLVRFIRFGGSFGGVCKCGWYTDQWRGSEGWVRRDWGAHVRTVGAARCSTGEAKGSAWTDRVEHREERVQRVDLLLQRGIITPREHHLMMQEVVHTFATKGA